MKIFIFIGNSLATMLNFRGNIIAELSKYGDRVFVLAPFDTKLISIKNVEFINFGDSERSLYISRFLKSIFTLRNFLCSIGDRNDLYIFSYSPKIIIISLIGTLRIKCSLHTFFIGLGSLFIHNKYLPVRFLLGFLINFSNSLKAAICLNRSDLFELSRYIKAKPIILMSGEGISTNNFKFIKHNINDYLRFIFISRPLVEKGALLFLESVRLFRAQFGLEAKFSIFGFNELTTNSDLPNYFFQHCHDLNIDINGYVNNIADFIGSKDVLILPSIREGMSRVCMEMKEYGLPVIGSNVPGIQDIIVNGETGFLIDDFSPPSYFDAMKYFHSMTEDEFYGFRKNIAQVHRRYFLNSDVNKFYLNLINQVN
jgi:glycosyltransferase involved in cell wall biosynthesis